MATPECPELATPPPLNIIVKENVESLKLSNYSRKPGTVVNVSCLTAPEYRLQGATTLTCLNTSQWDKAVPTCQRVDSNGTSVTESGEQFGISLVPVIPIVVAGSLCLILLLTIGFMIFVILCRLRARSKCQVHQVQRPHIALSRSLNVHGTESTFKGDHHRDLTTSEFSDVIDSISTRCPPYTHAHSTEVLARDPFSYRNVRIPRRARDQSVLGSSENLSTSAASTFYTAGSKETQPPLMDRVGSRQSYRTWHELFYP